MPANDATRKNDKFPEHIGGYVNPADPACSCYFDYNIKTGMIKPHADITNEELKARVKQTIRDLNLNREALCRERKSLNNQMCDKVRKYPNKTLRDALRQFTKRSSPFSSYALEYRAHLQSSPVCQ